VVDQSYTPAKGLVSLLAQTISISARFFVPLWSISAIFALPTSLFFDLLAWQMEDPRTDYIALPCTWVAGYVCFFILTGEISDIFRGGTTAISKGIGRVSVLGVVRLLGADALVWMMMGVAFFGTFFLLALLDGFVLDQKLGFILVLLSSLGPVFIVMTLFLFNSQVVVIEKLYWFSALGRSASLAWQSIIASVGIAIIFVLLYALLTVGIDMLLGSSLIALLKNNDLSDLLTHSELLHQHSQPCLAARIAGSALAAASIPIFSIFLTLGYFSVSRGRGGLSTAS